MNTKFLALGLGALMLSACVDSKPDEECTRADAILRGAMMSGCSMSAMAKINNEMMVEGATVVGTTAVSAAKVAAPLGISAVSPGAGQILEKTILNSLTSQ